MWLRLHVMNSRHEQQNTQALPLKPRQDTQPRALCCCKHTAWLLESSSFSGSLREPDRAACPTKTTTHSTQQRHRCCTNKQGFRGAGWWEKPTQPRQPRLHSHPPRDGQHALRPPDCCTAASSSRRGSCSSPHTKAGQAYYSSTSCLNPPGKKSSYTS